MSTTPQVSYTELIRTNANFRRLWFGSMASLLGDWFNTIALYTIVERLTGSPFALALVFITKMLPFALASPVAGLLVDRFDRRRLMIGCDTVRAVLVLGFLLIDEAAELPLLYGLMTLQVMLGAVYIPARKASIPNITTPAELLTANALMSATWSTLLAVGAAVGGFATALLGEAAVFVIDSATYLVSAFFILRMTIPQEKLQPETGPIFRTAARQIVDGWKHLKRRPEIGRISLAKPVWAISGGGLVYMLTLLAGELRPGELSIGIGLLFSARGLGTGIGPILGRALFKDQQVWPAVLGWCIAGSGLAYVAVAFVPWMPAWGAIGVVCAFVMLAHAPSGANWVFSTVMLQERTEDVYRGRVFASEWLLVATADSIAALAASLLIETGGMDLRTGFLWFAGIQIVCGLVWLATVVPAERAAKEVEMASSGDGISGRSEPTLPAGRRS